MFALLRFIYLALYIIMKNLLLTFIILVQFQFYGQDTIKIEGLESQIFNLDTISWKVIKGKNETEIGFSREDFEVNENQKLNLELKEYVNSSYIIFVNITSNGQSINLRKNRRIPIKVPEQSLKRKEIYHSEIIVDEKSNWTKLPLFSGIIHFDAKLQMDVIKAVRSDSLNYYRKKYHKYTKYNPVLYPIMIDRFGWFKVY